MKKNFNILSAFALVVLFSCNTPMETGPEPFLEENNSFVSQPLGFEIIESNLLERFPSAFKVINKAIQNKHDHNVIDTLKTIETKGELKDYFLIYKTQDKELLKEGKIRTDRIKLKDNIRVGMSKEEFAKKLNVETWPNLMKFCNTEQTINWTFYFSESKLDSIWYQGFVD